MARIDTNERCMTDSNRVFKSCDILQMEGEPGGTEQN